jgi:hypothetical protein
VHQFKRRKVGNDIKKSIALFGHLAKPGEYTESIAFHDDWCRHFKGKPCNCDPDIVWNPTEAQRVETLSLQTTPMTFVAFVPPKIN